MSMHTKEYLHDMIMVGGVEGIEDGKGWRKPSWWFEPTMENADKPSHFSGYLDIGLIRSRLFGWEVVDGGLTCTVDIRIPANHPLNLSGIAETKQVTFTINDHKAIVREDKLVELYLNDQLDLADETVMNVPRKDWQAHQFGKTLLDNVISIVGGGDNMGATGAGVLKWGKIAYVEVSIPETLHNSTTGIDFRPNLLASTAHDGSMATTYTRTITNVVCDNTLQWALSQTSEKTGKVKVRHTKNSIDRLEGVADALGIITQQVDEFTNILEEWSRVDVTPKQFQSFLDEVFPVPELKEKTRVMTSIQGEKIEVRSVSTNAQTIMLNKRDRVSQMYVSDERISPWVGTKLGVAQLGNTWRQHEKSFKGSKTYGGNKLLARVEMNQQKVIDGTFAKEDELWLKSLDKVLSSVDPESVTIPV